MANQGDFREVSLRLERLEQKLERLVEDPSVSQLTEKDVAAYHKVQNAFWEDGSCGINETSPCVFRCNIFKGGKVIALPRPKFCDIECTCGPCNLGQGGFGGAVRFRGLGG